MYASESSAVFLLEKSMFSKQNPFFRWDELGDLLGTLMSQLNTDKGREEFRALVEAEEPNSLGIALDAEALQEKLNQGP